MNKIILIGCPGSGKSTLARKLGATLNIPVHHLDAVMWRKDYEPIPYQEFLDAQEKIFKTDKWIIDGNFTKSIPRRLQEADTAIFFDIPKFICIWRLIKRYFKYYGKTRPDMGGNNKDKLGIKFLRFVLTYPTHQVRNILTAGQSRTRIITIKNNSDLKNFLQLIA